MARATEKTASSERLLMKSMRLAKEAATNAAALATLPESAPRQKEKPKAKANPEAKALAKVGARARVNHQEAKAALSAAIARNRGIHRKDPSSCTPRCDATQRHTN